MPFFLLPASNLGLDFLFADLRMGGSLQRIARLYGAGILNDSLFFGFHRSGLLVSGTPERWFPQPRIFNISRNGCRASHYLF